MEQYRRTVSTPLGIDTALEYAAVFPIRFLTLMCRTLYDNDGLQMLGYLSQ